jgi:uncharacterized membrane protein YdjX (TVP38/TMEM64 family)
MPLLGGVMNQILVPFFLELGFWSIFASLLINGLIHIVGFIPSVFVTTANVWIWGPWLGGILSWLGEVIGSVAAFLLYRNGIQVSKIQWHMNWKWIQSLNQSTAIRQIVTLIIIRITPIIPSGVVNLLVAWTNVSLYTFLFSTAIGKIPSIALEIWISYGLLNIKEYYIQLLLTLLSLGLGYLLLRKRRKTQD